LVRVHKPWGERTEALAAEDGAIVVAIRQGKEVVGTMSVAAPLIGLSDERVVDSAAPGEGKRAIWISPCNRHNRPKVSDVTGKLNKDRAAMPPDNCLT